MKICSMCKKVKSIGEFHKMKKAKDGLFPYCKPCRSKKNSENYFSDPEKNKVRVKNRYYEYKLQIIKHYGWKCNCCGESRIEFLSIDHVNSDGARLKEAGIHSRDSYAFFRWIIENKFPKFLQILCFNCNFGKQHNNGICPHNNQPEGLFLGYKKHRGRKPIERDEL